MTREEAIAELKFFKGHTFINTEEAIDMAIKALEQESCDNILTLTERVVTQVTEDMDNFIFTTIVPWCEAKEQRIISKRDLEQALTQYFSKEPCEDAISRQAVINAIANTCFWLSSDNWKELIKCINSIPPVKPQEPKTGHWEWVQYDYNPKLGNWHCSECRCVVLECVDKEDKGGIPLYKYCPQCGAKMVES